MKRNSVFLLFLVLCLMFTSFSVPALADPHIEYITNPTGRTVNVRQGPGKDYVVDVELKPGTQVTVEEINGAWSRISSPVVGYVMSKYLTDVCPAPGGGVIPSTMTRYIYSPNGKKVNLRHGPSTTGYGIAAQVESGTEVALLHSVKGGWSAVKYGGFTVYVMSKYLSTNKYGPSTPSSFKAFDARIYSKNGKKVNYRVKPDVKSDRIAQLEPWTNIEVVGQSGGWYKVRYGVSTGYIMKKYVRAK